MRCFPADPVLRRIGSIVSFLAFTACVLAQSPSAERRDTPSSMLTSYGELPGRLCLDVDETTLKALQEGKKRLTLHVQNQKPSPRYGPTFTVYLVDPGSFARIAIERFSMHPDRGPRDQALPKPQHFSFDVSDRIAPLASKGSLCVEIGVDANDSNFGEHSTAQVMISATFESVGK